MIREDGPEKTKQLFVGILVLFVIVWVGYQFWFGKGLFEGKAFNDGLYGSGASEMIQLLVYLVMQVGAIALGLFRFTADILKMVGGFFVGNSDSKDNSKPLLVKPTTNKTSSSIKVKAVDVSPVFRTNANGLLYRDELLEKQLSGPQTPEELAADAVDALMSGDVDRLNERVSQLYPEKKTSVEVKVDESGTQKA